MVQLVNFNGSDKNLLANVYKGNTLRQHRLRDIVFKRGIIYCARERNATNVP